MTRKAVKSSNIKSVGYDATTKTLEVEFTSGGVHQYSGVSAAKHAALIKAKSVGSYFHREIRDSHHSKQIQ
jgi:hypothetical protein